MLRNGGSGDLRLASGKFDSPALRNHERASTNQHPATSNAAPLRALEHQSVNPAPNDVERPPASRRPQPSRQPRKDKVSGVLNDAGLSRWLLAQGTPAPSPRPHAHPLRVTQHQSATPTSWPHRTPSKTNTARFARTLYGSRSTLGIVARSTATRARPSDAVSLSNVSPARGAVGHASRSLSPPSFRGNTAPVPPPTPVPRSHRAAISCYQTPVPAALGLPSRAAGPVPLESLLRFPTPVPLESLPSARGPAPERLWRFAAA
jgi:hypothetical protein